MLPLFGFLSSFIWLCCAGIWSGASHVLLVLVASFILLLSGLGRVFQPCMYVESIKVATSSTMLFLVIEGASYGNSAGCGVHLLTVLSLMATSQIILQIHYCSVHLWLM